MSGDHKFVMNRKTGVVHGRNKSLDGHPDCVPYYPPEEGQAKAAEAAAPRATRGRRKASAPESAAAAAAAAAAADTQPDLPLQPPEEIDYTLQNGADPE